MNTNLQTWSYGNSEIRTIEKDGETWWVLSDVCKVLELSSPHKVADRLEADERNQIPTLFICFKSVSYLVRAGQLQHLAHVRQHPPRLTVFLNGADFGASVTPRL